MPIFGAIGLGIGILVLKVLTPEIFSELDKTIIIFLHGAQVSIAAATQLAAVASQIPLH